jgi:hypothetical protein
MLLFENIAIMINNKKIMSNISLAIDFELGREEAQLFHTKTVRRVQGSNKSRLGWTNKAFNEVDWTALEPALSRRPNEFQLWLSKQAIGVCTMQKNTARIQDILDDCCPNCGKRGKDNKHLNRCHGTGHMRLFRDVVRQLKVWIHKCNQTDSELAFWINEYLLHRGQVQMTNLVRIRTMSAAMYEAVQGQDRIGWVEFLGRKVSTKIRAIQQAHCVIANTPLNADNWMVQFNGKLMDTSHLQWLYRNYMLHNCTKGYLQQRTVASIQREVNRLSHAINLGIPPNSCYLLKLPLRPSAAP